MFPDDFDMSELLSQAQALQAQMMELQQQLTTSLFTGTAGGGLVKLTMNGEGDLKEVVIDPAAVDVDDLESLADLIIAAHRDARTQIHAKASSVLPDIPGLDGLGGAGGLPGLPSLGDLGGSF